ncbi:hypothetical protein ARMGADRAFT_692072 [Armillaria gallica]|uniref:Uncharacterized protein n=1 Tax=Armillaria gallica TaxID=47427 RepID=A0A2H3DM55_ARMGA|nr:hypothetical protein ARMGADRAFT_692072 [Armillaria gallica]
MSSIVLPSRGQCIHIIDDSQPCQCQWFFPPESPLLDQVGSHSPLSVFLYSQSPSSSAACVDTVFTPMPTMFRSSSIIIPRINAPRMPRRYAALPPTPYLKLTMTCAVDTSDAVLHLWSPILRAHRYL